MRNTLSRLLVLFILTSPAAAAPEMPGVHSPVHVIAADLNDARPGEWEKLHEAMCQPEGFDPGKTAFAPKQDEYNLAAKWKRQFVDGVKLPEPFAFKAFIFPCSPDDVGYSDAVLEITKSGKRYALYQHIQGFSFSQDGRTLFLSNAREVSKDVYQGFVGLIDIETKKKTPLPRLPCVASTLTSERRLSFFNGNRLVTVADNGTDVCVWGTDAKLLYRTLVSFHWHLGDDWATYNESIGLLPSDPDVMYAYGVFGTTECRLWLQSLKVRGLANSVVVDAAGPAIKPGEAGDCPLANLDLSRVNLSGGPVRFQRQTPDSPNFNPKYLDWEEASIPTKP